MQKEKLTRMQILVGALLKFGEVNISDLHIIGDEAKKNYTIEENGNSNIKLYLQTKNGFIYLKDGLSLDYVVPSNSICLRELFGQEQGSIMENYYSNLDEEEYVLRKIDNQNGTDKEKLMESFCTKHKEIINELFNKNMIITTYNEDIIHCDYPEIKLTYKGKTRLFIADHKE